MTFLPLVTSQYPLLLNVALAFLLGGVIGFERELKHKPVGLRTCIILSVASCLLTVISIRSAAVYSGDPMRLAAQIVSGIGFLGVGVILQRQDGEISGLTTAAIVWSASGIGIACGAGFYLEAILCTSMILLAIRMSRYIRLSFHRTEAYFRDVQLSMVLPNIDRVNETIQLLKDQGCTIDNMTLKDHESQRIVLEVMIGIYHQATIPQIYSMLKKIDQIQNVSIRH